MAAEAIVSEKHTQYKSPQNIYDRLARANKKIGHLEDKIRKLEAPRHAPPSVAHLFSEYDPKHVSRIMKRFVITEDEMNADRRFVQIVQEKLDSDIFITRLRGDIEQRERMISERSETIEKLKKRIDFLLSQVGR